MTEHNATPDGRTKRLKEATREAHERLDKGIMAYDPFANREAYGRFLDMQYRLHSAANPLYRDADLGGLLPDLAARSRLERVEADLSDLGRDVPDAAQALAPAPGKGAALGWLYVVEGSNLGAAFLLKASHGLGLGEDFGARHLAGDPNGRGLHWRTFTAALDTIELTPVEEADLIEGAKAAFAYAHRLADESFADA